MYLFLNLPWGNSLQRNITLLLSIHLLSIIIERFVCFLHNSSVSSEPKRKRKRSSECSETLTTNGISSLRLGSLKSEPGMGKQLAVNFLVYKCTCSWYFCFQMNDTDTMFFWVTTLGIHNCGCNKKRSFTRMGSHKHPCGASSEESVNWAFIYENYKTKGKTGQSLAMAAYESFYITWVNSQTGSYRAEHLPEWSQGRHWLYHDFHIITPLFISLFPWTRQLHLNFL